MSMRILANENVAESVVHGLRTRGHDVAWIWEDARGSADDRILLRAQRETRIVLTFDKDFGMLAFHAGLPSSCGIILARVRGGPELRAERVLEAVDSRPDWVGHFVVIENHKLRVRKLPSIE